MYRHPIAEHHGHTAICVHRYIIHHAAPQLLVEIPERCGLPLKRLDETSQTLCLDRPRGDGLRHLVKPLLGGIVPHHQSVVAFLVLPLVLGNPCILGDAVLGHLHQHRKFLPQGGFLLLQLRCVAESLPDEPRIGDNLLPLRHQTGEGRLDFLLGHMGRLAFMPVVLLVAAVDDPAVLVGRMPNLGSKGVSALAAFYLTGENAHAAVSAACTSSKVSGAMMAGWLCSTK